MSSSRRLVEPPAALPVSVDELKADRRITWDDDNAELANVIRDAVSHLQGVSGVQLVAGRYRSYRDSFPACAWHLRPWPLLAVNSVIYVDGDGDEATLDADDYLVDSVSTPGLVDRSFGLSWPAARRQVNSCYVDYYAGCAVPVMSIDPTANTLTVGVYVPPNDLAVWLSTDGELPSELAADTAYYVVSRDADARTVKLAATSGGSAINLTGKGAGRHWLHVAQDDVWRQARRAVLVLAGHWWEHREEQVEGSPLRPISHGVQRILDTIHAGDDFVRDEA